MDPKALSRIERINYALGAVLVVIVAVLGSSAQILGAAVGATLSAVNFSLVRRLVERVALAPAGDRGRPMLLFLPKMTGLMVAVALALYFLPLSPVMLAAGFSIFLLSIAIETIRFVAGPRGGAGGAETDHG
jgi:hypothetical protein